jgi:hypothetical protein
MRPGAGSGELSTQDYQLPALDFTKGRTDFEDPFEPSSESKGGLVLSSSSSQAPLLAPASPNLRPLSPRSFEHVESPGPNTLHYLPSDSTLPPIENYPPHSAVDDTYPDDIMADHRASTVPLVSDAEHQADFHTLGV